MTLVVALVTGDGVLVSADSRASSGLVYHEERKIRPVMLRSPSGEQLYLAVVGGAGDAALVKQGFSVVEDAFRRWLETTRSDRNPDEEGLRAVVSDVESALMERYSRLRSMGVEPDASLLLASVTGDGRPALYVFDSRGLAEPVHENPGYALLGRGVVTGGLLVMRLLDYSPGGASGWDLGLFSAFVIDAVSEVDPSVSPFLGESYYIRYDRELGRVVIGALKEEAYREYKERIRKRRELIKLVWSLSEALGEDAVEAALRRLERRLARAGGTKG